MAPPLLIELWRQSLSEIYRKQNLLYSIQKDGGGATCWGHISCWGGGSWRCAGGRGAAAAGKHGELLGAEESHQVLERRSTGMCWGEQARGGPRSGGARGGVGGRGARGSAGARRSTGRRWGAEEHGKVLGAPRTEEHDEQIPDLAKGRLGNSLVFTWSENLQDVLHFGTEGVLLSQGLHHHGFMAGYPN